MTVTVFALDGFDPDLLKLDEFANIRDLFNNNPSSLLKSTIPYLTSSAFVSMQTGKDVGKHGVSGFLKFDGESLRPYSGSDIKDKTFYEIITEHRKKCFLFSMPYSYPPRIPGDVVYDWLSVGKTDVHSCVYPSTLFESYPELYDYKIFPDGATGISDYMLSIRKSTEATINLIKHVATSKRYDFKFFLIRATDWIQHFFHKQIIEGEKSTSVRIARDVFAKLDELVRFVSQNVNGNDEMIIMSDHGFTTYRKRFYINDWLKDEGYLTTSDKAISSLEKARYPFLFDENPYVSSDRVTEVPSIISKLAREHHFLTKVLEPFKPRIERLLKTSFVTGQPLDMDRSLAFSVEESEGSIYINRKQFSEDQAEDLKKELMSKLSSINDMNIHDSKVLYGPSLADHLPDIYLTSSKYWIRRGLAGTIFSDVYQSHHRREGILVLSGEAFEKPASSPSVMDLGPTILHIMNCPVPDDMQGRVLTESLSPSSEASKRRVRYVTPVSSNVQSAQALAPEEEQVIEERLRKLGYV